MKRASVQRRYARAPAGKAATDTGLDLWVQAASPASHGRRRAAAISRYLPIGGRHQAFGDQQDGRKHQGVDDGDREDADVKAAEMIIEVGGEQIGKSRDHKIK